MSCISVQEAIWYLFYLSLIALLRFIQCARTSFSTAQKIEKENSPNAVNYYELYFSTRGNLVSVLFVPNSSSSFYSMRKNFILNSTKKSKKKIRQMQYCLFRTYGINFSGIFLWRRYNSAVLEKFDAAYIKCIKMFFGMTVDIV